MLQCQRDFQIQQAHITASQSSEFVNKIFSQSIGTRNFEESQDQLLKLVIEEKIAFERLIEVSSLLQHYPMYRESDEICNELDQAPDELKAIKFRERWECLSKEASEQVHLVT